MHVIRIPWLSDRPRWFRITAIAMVFTGLAVGLSYLIVDTVHKSGETACLADSLDRKFRRGIDFSKLSTEKRAQIKREAMISAYVLIKGQSGTSASHCHKGWEVVGNIKGLGWRIAKALIGVTPSRNHRKELMQEVAFEAMRDRFSGIDTGAVTGVCTYRASKIRQAVPPWVLEPFAGWKKVHSEGSVAVYCKPAYDK